MVLITGWLCASSCVPPPARTDDWQVGGGVSSYSQLAITGAALQTLALKETTQESGRASAPGQTGGVSGLLRSWSRMAEHAQEKQPNWLSPIATTSGRLKQEFRYDVWRRQPTVAGETDYTFGGGKGLEFIVAPRLQVLIGVPSYVAHSAGGTRDGFGDIPLMLKFRLASAAAKEGDYLLALLLGATLPTGSFSIGMHEAVLSPGIAFGKGWGRLDVQSTIGANFPTGDTAKLGRQFLWNTAFQYRARWKLWPELEVNSTSFLAGKNAGETRAYLTPGLGFGRVHLWGPLGFSAGAGLQIAATHFHTYNHGWIFSIRFPFLTQASKPHL